MALMTSASTQPDLTTAKADEIDLAKVALNYDRFRELAQNANLSAQQKIGFPDTYRDGFDAAILADIITKLGGLDKQGAILADIGCGCGTLIHSILDHCTRTGVRPLLIDSKEMLDHLEGPDLMKITGRYPDNADAVRNAAPEGADYVLCYSVLHYIYVETNLFSFLDHVIDLLKPGGLALIGDIPNISKRKRFFSSAEGIAYHQNFMKTTDKPQVEFLKVEHGHIDDAILAALAQRAQAAGCDAYVLPQNSDLPMANRRDDLLIRKY